VRKHEASLAAVFVGAVCLGSLTTAHGAVALAPPVWQIGEFFADTGEFTGAAGQEVVYAIAEPERKRGVPIPAQLVGSGGSGCRRLRLTFSLPAGSYAFVRGVKRPGSRKAVLGQVFINGREAGCYFTTALPDEGLAATPRPAADYRKLAVDRPGSPRVVSPPEYQCIVYPFLCLSEGTQDVMLCLDAEINKPLSLELDALAVVPWTIVPRPHSVTEEVPGRVFLDAWGWMGTAWYQRSGPVDMTYFEDKLIAESADRGSNYLQLHPSLDQNPWKNAGIEARPVLRAVHARDMLADEHCFPPKSAKPEQPAARPRREAKAVKADNTENKANPVKPKKVLVSPQVILDWFEKDWAPLVADAAGHGWQESVDGFEGEALNQIFEGPLQLKRMTDLVWRSNPGLWASHASFPCGPVWLSEPKYRTPNYLKSPVCLHFLGMSLGPPEGGRVGIVGYDDKMPYIHPFPGCEGLHPSAGKMFLGYQADCRLKGTEVIRRPSRWIGGGSSADWVLKQVDDFFRSRARWPDDPHETAIWWLGEPVETLPQEYRDYVYAINQDPIKRALAATHAHGGIGGFFEQHEKELRKQAEAEKADISEAEWWKLRRRAEFPADSHFVQNAYLRLNLLPDRDGGVLQYDLERLAHFDSDGVSIPLTESLLAAQGNATEFTQKFEIEQRGGHLAVLTARVGWKAGVKGRISEERSFSVVNDAPYVTLELTRTATEVTDAVRLALGAEGYDVLRADGKEFRQGAVFSKSSLPSVLELRDSRDIKPELALLVLDAGGTSAVEWTAGKSVTLVGAANDRVRLAWVVPTDLYDQAGLARLPAALKNLVYPLTPKGGEVSSPHGVSHAVVARIENPGKGPYLVQENGWWTVRGAQRALLGSDQSDYLKVYLPAGQTARVLPYGLIDGAAKPGYGCQYTVALRNMHGESGGASCEARVLSVTPFLFAPRVEFARPIAAVELDGQPWHYFEGTLVFLPNTVGNHRLRVTYGSPIEPGLTRTFACVRKTAWSGSSLQLEASDPPWSGPLPEDVFYYAFLRSPAGAPKSVEGGKLLEKKNDFWLLQFRPGVIRLNW
jgi:hypothetical protein